MSGVIVQADSTEMPLEGVTVKLGDAQIETDTTGKFLFEDVTEGTKTLTATLDGYDSASQSVDVTSSIDNLRIKLHPSGTPIDVTGTAFGNLNNTSTSNSTFDLKGNVADFGFQMSTSGALSANSRAVVFDTYISLNRLQALVNGVVYDVQVDSGGRFDATLPLNPGDNTIQLRVYASDGQAHISGPVVVTATFDSLEMRVLLRWDTPGDVDIHMFKRSAAEGNVTPPSPIDPMGGDFWNHDRHLFYSNKTPTDFGVGTQNPFLDIDDTSGYGPETIVMQQIPAGGDQKYHIWVHYYDMPANVTATNVVVDVMLNEADRANPVARRFEKTLTEHWESWYVTTITYPGGTFSHEPPGSN